MKSSRGVPECISKSWRGRKEKNVEQGTLMNSRRQSAIIEGDNGGALRRALRFADTGCKTAGKEENTFVLHAAVQA